MDDLICSLVIEYFIILMLISDRFALCEHCLVFEILSEVQRYCNIYTDKIQRGPVIQDLTVILHFGAVYHLDFYLTSFVFSKSHPQDVP